jgi:acetolactate synthase-1/2/3 large subunit
MLGIPQDVAEKTWISWSSLAAQQPRYHATSPDKKEIHSASELLVRHHRIIILIDDYLLTYREAKLILTRFSELIHAPVLQIQYRRGPMLFERLMRSEVPNFMGWLDFESCEHQSMFDAADLLVTLEDRNMYCRVIGDLPACPKIAISSDASKVLKNEYLNEGDLLIEADVMATLRAICDELVHRGKTRKESHWAHSMEVLQPAPSRRITPAVESLRMGLVKSIAQVMASLDAPVLVDDSQMFGGLISEYYDLLPAKLRIFGYHGGFVGGGISYSTGLAIGNPTEQVICALGDQGFINGLQGFIAAQQEQANVVFLVCNNGGSISLLKQLSAVSKREVSQDSQSYLANTPGIEYVRIATALGIAAWAIDFPSDRGSIEIQRALSTFEGVLAEAFRVDGPSLIELRLPGLGEFWTGIWRTQGYDESACKV